MHTNNAFNIAKWHNLWNGNFAKRDSCGHVSWGQVWPLSGRNSSISLGCLQNTIYADSLPGTGKPPGRHSHFRVNSGRDLSSKRWKQPRPASGGGQLLRKKEQAETHYEQSQHRQIVSSLLVLENQYGCFLFGFSRAQVAATLGWRSSQGG